MREKHGCGKREKIFSHERKILIAPLSLNVCIMSIHQKLSIYFEKKLLKRQKESLCYYNFDEFPRDEISLL